MLWTISKATSAKDVFLAVLFLIISVPPSILCLKCYNGTDDTIMPEEIDAEVGAVCVYTFRSACEFKDHPGIEMFRTSKNLKPDQCSYFPKYKRSICSCVSDLCNGNIDTIRVRLITLT
ncbi:hypothetical protein OESDEN_20936, partial [Oesophagostomum dentatum]